MTSPATLRVHADLGRLAEVRGFVREGALSLGAEAAAIDDLVQAVDEWVTNVVVHGYRGVGGPLDITIRGSTTSVEVVVKDEAPPFDPADAPPFDPTVPLERRRFGGMGIHLIREVAERFEHRALPGGGNEVTIAIALRARGGPQ